MLEGFVSCVVTSEHRHANHRWGVDVVQLPLDINTIRLVLIQQLLIVHTATAWKYEDLGRLLQILKDIVALYLIPLITPRNLTKEQRLGQKNGGKRE